MLTDFKAHANWNPLNVWADGEALPGARVGMRFVDAGGGKGKIIAQTVTVTACDPGRRLDWVGHIPFLFTGRHFFELAESDDGTELARRQALARGFVRRRFAIQLLGVATREKPNMKI